MDTYMADVGSTTVAPRDTLALSSTNDFSTAGANLVDLSTYLRNSTTAHFYCWDAAGLITAQDDVLTADCTRTN